ncbi:MAG: hypothetical protein IKH36_01760 [Bacilli bacterium]|nr:hypothetical protein [Bacilli bacterium]
MGFLFNTNSINQTSGGGSGGDAVWGNIGGTLSNQTDLQNALNAKQNTLISGTNIKTINNNSILGSGNLEINASVDTDNVTINKNSSNKLQTFGIKNARTETAIRLWTGNQTQYDNGDMVTFYNWQSGGIRINYTNIWSFSADIAYGNGKYVAVGKGGAIYSSTDKENWTAETSNVSEDLLGIAYGNNKFVVVGNSGTIISSSGDGTWTAETSGTSTNITSIAFGNNLFACYDGEKVYYSSGDGTWNNVARSAYNGKIMFCTDRFCLVSARLFDSITFYTSTDASTWTTAAYKTFSTLRTLYYICGSGDYVYVSIDTTNGDYYYCVAFSISSSQTTIMYNRQFSDVVYANGTYYAINYTRYTKQLMSSSNETSFTSLGNSGSIKYLCYGDALVGISDGTLDVLTYGTPINAYTTDEEPTTSSVVYSEPNVTSALTITSIGTGTITCSDSNTYTYNSSGNQTVIQTVGQAHPDWLCFIENVGIKIGNVSFIPTITVDQTYNASSTNAQSGVAVASGISDTLGTINTQLESIIAQGD